MDNEKLDQHDQYDQIIKGFNRIIALLEKINGKLAFFMLLVIIGLIISFFSSCMMTPY